MTFVTPTTFYAGGYMRAWQAQGEEQSVPMPGSCTEHVVGSRALVHF